VLYPQSFFFHPQYFAVCSYGHSGKYREVSEHEGRVVSTHWHLFRWLPLVHVCVYLILSSQQNLNLSSSLGERQHRMVGPQEKLRRSILEYYMNDSDPWPGPPSSYSTHLCQSEVRLDNSNLLSGRAEIAPLAPRLRGISSPSRALLYSTPHCGVTAQNPVYVPLRRSSLTGATLPRGGQLMIAQFFNTTVDGLPSK
jgi:hypothetical protein